MAGGFGGKLTDPSHALVDVKHSSSRRKADEVTNITRAA